jgi:uncharacterized protein (DUF433 family)
MPATPNALLVRTPGTCGGRIRIEGTRITVHRVATLYKQGLSAEEIAQTYPHLTLAQIYTAVGYFLDHREEIEQDLKSDQEEYDRLRSSGA